MVKPAGLINLAVDTAGNVYASTVNEINFTSPELLVFGPTANGNAAPSYTMALASPIFTVDGSGNLYNVAAGGAGINAFSCNATACSAKNPFVVNYTLINGMTTDRMGRLYIGVGGGSPHIGVWSAETSTPALVDDISHSSACAGQGTATLLTPAGMAVDKNGFLYVADNGAGAVFVFSPGANGNVCPVYTIPDGILYGVAVAPD
jgi:hypothetical protein